MTTKGMLYPPTLLFLLSMASVTGSAQVTPNLVTSITYGQSTTNTATTMDIHVSLLQPTDAGFPCVAGTTATVDPLALANSDVKSSDGTPAHVVSEDLQKTSEQGGYVFHIPVGEHYDLPTTWESFTFSVPAHCSDGSLPQRSPRIAVRRFAATDPLQIQIIGAGSQPEWNRIGGEDTLSFVMKSNRAVTIHSLLIKDPQDHDNVVTKDYSEADDSVTHNIILQAKSQLAPNHQYSYYVEFTAGSMPVAPAQPLLPFSTYSAPTQAYALLQTPNQNQLTIHDNSQDFTFTALANDQGSLNAVFEGVQIGQSNTLPSATSADGLTHTFTIHKKDFPADGQYSFHFDGTRTVVPPGLSDPHESILIVSTKTLLQGPVSLSLKNGKIVVGYCLSQKTPNTVKIVPASNPSMVYSGADGQFSAASGCGDGKFGYTASPPLNDFVSNSTTNNSPASSASAPASPPSGGPEKAAATANQTIPIQISIVDLSAAPGSVPLATVNLDAVFLAAQSQSPADISKITAAITTLSTKNPPKEQAAAATKTLTDVGVQPETITALGKLGKNSGTVASTVGSVLGSFGKSALSAFLGLGIPAAQTAQAPAKPATQ